MTSTNKASLATCIGIMLASITGATQGDIVQEIAGGSISLHQHVFGQSFTAEGGEIASIGIGLLDTNSHFGIFEITIDLHESIGGMLLDTQTLMLTEGHRPNWTDFDFSGNNLVADDVYSFIITSTSGRGFVEHHQHRSPNGQIYGVDYTGGDRLDNGIPNPIWDLKFRVIQAPAPASLSLIGGGLVLMTRRRRRTDG